MKTMQSMKKSCSIRGFTLIEVMIVLAIVAILVAIAVPSYQQYVVSARRSDASIALTTAAQALERCSINSNNVYTACGQADYTSSEGYYTISTVAAAKTFTITATPIAGQPQAADSQCTTLTLTNTGLKGKTGTAANVNDCW